MTSPLTGNIANGSAVHKYDFWILWIAANAIGTILGTITFYILALSLGFFGSPSLPGQYTDAEIAWTIIVGDFQAFIPFGALIGIMQWLVLRKHMTSSGVWFLTSAIAMFLGSAVNDLLPIFFHLSSISIQPFVLWFLFGLVNGLLQWIRLRKQVYYSGWWIVVNFLSGSVAGILSTGNLGLIGGCLGWAFSGIITGGAMHFLIQNKLERINVA